MYPLTHTNFNSIPTRYNTDNTHMNVFPFIGSLQCCVSICCQETPMCDTTETHRHINSLADLPQGVSCHYPYARKHLCHHPSDIFFLQEVISSLNLKAYFRSLSKEIHLMKQHIIHFYSSYLRLWLQTLQALSTMDCQVAILP